MVQVVRMFRMRPSDINQIGAFQSMHKNARQDNFGHMFRSPSLWEDMVKSITLCNCGYACLPCYFYDPPKIHLIASQIDAASPVHQRLKQCTCTAAHHLQLWCIIFRCNAAPFLGPIL